MTLPGVDLGIAATLMAALGDITRFSDGAHAASYLDLVPSTRQSGDPCARWLLVQAAQHLSAHPGPLGVFFRRLAKRKNRNVAVVATARKLVAIAWHMLAHNEPYRYALPRSTEAKFSRLRVRATGQRRRGGIPKGSPRPAGYGRGGSRRLPALAQAYAAENLPAPLPLALGEHRMLADNGLTPFHQRLGKGYRIPKPAAPKPLPDSNLRPTEKIS